MVKHRYGKYETVKFDHRREDFQKYLHFIDAADISNADFMEHYTAYVGHMSLHRTLTLYELYKKVENVAGHVAEVGVYKGAGSILFAKLIKIHESESLTQVHGFDWFKGTGPSGEQDSSMVPEGGYKESYEFVQKLIELQKLDNIVRLHNLDVRAELAPFFQQNQHLQFKLVFLDAGMYDVMQACIPLFWERLTPGGIMVFDQFNHELAPGETLSIRELLPGAKVRTIRNAWMPNAFVIKS
ncbi:class I SAM-dependent methyltransferase [uncultured Pseudodesulfovibrio sp.]|uniref:class I SAM-dependent methyltransferase n=1 Tax=uncultured Pseudodesulfovibrio sp. TaxID=2035858 RepID=UPI0029C86A72|nr:class I SAM-dependent methyltransferase [uncultured Pseudodesulfovibrio sp.]